MESALPIKAARINVDHANALEQGLEEAGKTHERYRREDCSHPKPRSKKAGLSTGKKSPQLRVHHRVVLEGIGERLDALGWARRPKLGSDLPEWCPSGGLSIMWAGCTSFPCLLRIFHLESTCQTVFVFSLFSQVKSGERKS